MMPMTSGSVSVQGLPSVHTRHSPRVGLLVGLLSIGILLSPAEGATHHRRAATPQKASRTVHPKKRSTPAPPGAQLSGSRRARLSRAKAARTRAQWLESQQPRYKLDDEGTIVPDIRAAAAIIYNPDNGQVLWEENSQNKRSIASITKVMTTTVFLEGHPDLTRVVTVDRSDVLAARHTYLRANDQVTLDDLLHLTLIASDNAAARALARSSPQGTDAFVHRMNEKALELGLDNTTYADPSGLDPANMSSAYDMARLIAFAAGDERIASVMRTPYYTVRTPRRSTTVHSTNQLVMKGDVDVRGGKTGFISQAGYCLATLLRLPQTNQLVAVVVLGAHSIAGRFMETRHLFNWLNSKATDFFAKTAVADPQ